MMILGIFTFLKFPTCRNIIQIKELKKIRTLKKHVKNIQIKFY